MPVAKLHDSSFTSEAALERKQQGRARYNQMMKLARRAHLYAGLFMTPWVFLYGISALLFNHPNVFPDANVIRFGPTDTAKTAMANVPRPHALAGRIVAALNATTKETSTNLAYRLVQPEQAHFARDFFATLRGEGQEHNIRLDLASGVGTIRSQQRTTGKPAPFATKEGIKLDPRPFEPVTKGLPDFLGHLGIASEATIERTFVPDLSFLMERGGQTWHVTYSPQSGQLSGQPESEGEALSTRSYLQRLHLTHEYPSEFSARWFWAAGVDAMFISMVGWGATGLLMWWQMKKLRKVGIVVLFASAVTATTLAIGMHRIFTS